MWPQLAKADIIRNLRERRWNALHDQPAELQLLRADVDRLRARPHASRAVTSTSVRQTYETGGFWSRTYRVDAPDDLRNTHVGQNMQPADWMLIATMRNAENAIFGTSPDNDGVLSQIQG